MGKIKARARFRKATEIFYNRLTRPLTPIEKSYIVKVGVKVSLEKSKLDHFFDDYFFFDVWNEREEMKYEHKIPNMEMMRDELAQDSKVVIVGGGSGHTAAVACDLLGEKGKLTIFEPNQKALERLATTVELNNPECGVEIRDVVVGKAYEVENFEGDKVPVSKLPECDLLDLDCEGAEKHILDSMDIEPDTVIVETHPEHGSDTESVIEILELKGYCIKSREEDRLNGDVLTAVRK